MALSIRPTGNGGKRIGRFLTVVLKKKYEDLEALKADLAIYRMRLKEGEIEMKVLVIRSNKE